MPFISHMLLPSVAEENPKPSSEWGEAAVHGEPWAHTQWTLFWMETFSSSSRNTLASGDWPSYNCISLCYWSLGLPQLEQATFDFFGIIQSVFCQHFALSALCKPNWPLLWPLVPSIHEPYFSEFTAPQIRSLLFYLNALLTRFWILSQPPEYLLLCILDIPDCSGLWHRVSGSHASTLRC